VHLNIILFVYISRLEPVATVNLLENAFMSGQRSLVLVPETATRGSLLAAYIYLNDYNLNPLIVTLLN
jgi:hypothetical protein